MKYDEAIKVIWPDAYCGDVDKVWYTNVNNRGVPLTFDALLSVWRERLNEWYWDKTQDDIIEYGDRTGAADTFTLAAYPRKGAGWIEVGGCTNILKSFAILTALTLQAKEPK